MFIMTMGRRIFEAVAIAGLTALITKGVDLIYEKAAGKKEEDEDSD
tara:strand:+ start:1339 stop:1476 length:138 start_codon:yes stop_codon:yes gene_type:complete